MSAEVSTSMRLRSYQEIDFGEFQDYVIEDTQFLSSISARVVEDLELVIYVLAQKGKSTIADHKLTAEAVRIYGHVEEEPLEKVSHRAMVAPEQIREQLKSPVKPDGEALMLISKFVNFYLFHAVMAAAKRAAEEGTDTITQQHFFTWCHLLPYPLNVYLC